MDSFNKVVKKLRKSNMWELLFYSLAIFLILIIINNYNNPVENFENNKAKFITKNNKNLYDDFYVAYYDELLFSNDKNNYEVGNIIKNTNMKKKSYILDIGSGTGHHVKLFNDNGHKCIGIDKSKAMIVSSRKKYPKLQFKHGDALDYMLFFENTFTHITCLYFTIYYFKNKKHLFDNCFKWLMPGGYLAIHLVNKDKFDPILPAGNPFYGVSVQDYAKKRITNTNVKFDDSTYKANFKYSPSKEISTLTETFNNGKIVRQQEHTLYMPTQKHILELARDSGFTLLSKIKMDKIKYDDQFIYILKKPN